MAIGIRFLQLHGRQETSRRISLKSKEARRAYDKEYYQRTKSWRGARMKENYKNLQHQYRVDKVKYLLKHPCVDCGETDPIVLDFDHRPGWDKKFTIGLNTNYCFATLEKEIKKCDVRCANCHRRKTAVQFQWGMLDIIKTLGV